MKKIACSALAAFVLLTGAGCDRRSDISDRHNKNTEEKQPEDSAMAEAAAEQGYGEDAAQPGTDSRVAQQQADTTLFAVKAASGGMLEVSLGQLAQQQGMNADVKQFGQIMVNDHGKANAELIRLAKSKKMALPTAPLPRHQQHADHLKSLKGTGFDKAYMDMMVNDHQQTIADFQRASQSETDPELKAFAQKTLPVLRKHLDLARKTQAKVQQTTGKPAKG
jgi:putative membrane protein